MKILIITSLALLTFSFKFENKLTCKNFKTGKFKLTDSITGDFIIERNDSIQIEKSVKYGDTLIYRINWVNDCEYELVMQKGREELMNIFKGKILIVRIIETYKETYKFESYLKGTNDKYYQKIRKIH